jgi:ureidoacrylate peracid hydrolase
MADLTSTPERDTLAEIVDPAHTAVLVIDMQNDFCSPRGGAAKAGVDVSMMQEMLPALVGLLRDARAREIPIVFLQVVHAADGRTISKSHLRLVRSNSPEAPFGIEGTWGAEIIDELERRPNEPVVVKHRSSGFVNTTLDTLLRSMRIETVLITGEQTPGCVEATVRGADDHDYCPVIVTDCVGGLRRDLHEAAMKVMTARWPSATASEIVTAWNSADRRILR